MNKNTIFVVVVLVIILGGLLLVSNNNETSATSEGNYYETTTQDVIEKLKNEQDIVLLDVRTQEEYNESHIKGSILLSLQNLNEETLSEIGLNDKNQEIVIYCRSGNRSKQAYDLMKNYDYTNIKSMAGGINKFSDSSFLE